MNLSETLFGSNGDLLGENRFRLLLLANINSSIGIAVLSPILQILTGPFSVSNNQVGLLIAAFYLPGIVGIPLAGALTDRIGRKPILFVSLLVFGIAGAGIAFTTDFQTALILRILQGIGYAGVTPVVITSLGDMYDGARGATAHGLRFMSSGIAQAAVPLIASVLVILNWRYPFLIFLFAVPVSIAVYVWFTEPSGTASTDEQFETRQNTRWQYIQTLIQSMVRPGVLAVVIALMITSFLFTIFLTYNSILIVGVLNGTTGQAGIFLTVVSLTNATIASQSGRLANMLGGSGVPLLIAFVAMGGGLAVFGLASSFVLVAVSVLLIGLGSGIAYSLLRSVIADIPSSELRGGVVSLAESIKRIGNTTAPIVIGGMTTLLGTEFVDSQSMRLSIFLAGLVFGALGVGAVLIAMRSPEVSLRRAA